VTSHAEKADNLLIKPTADARPAPQRTLGRFIRKTRNRGLTPDECLASDYARGVLGTSIEGMRSGPELAT
jgi:hypothetical protein